MHTQKFQNQVTTYESEMKALILDHWLRSGKISPSDTIINEFTFNGFNRRIDLAILKENELIGVEIKSEADSLERLEGQLEEYNSFFDKVFVFTCERHIEKSLKLIREEQELLVLNRRKIKVLKRGKKKPIKEKISYIKMMRANELSQVIRDANKSFIPKSRKQLETAALKLPRAKLRENSFKFLRRRFSDSSAEFWRTLGHKITIENIESLHRKNLYSNTQQKRNSIASMIKSGEWAANIDVLS